MFKSHVFNVSRLTDMHETCGNCGLLYEREPGFFYGAMYVSYAFSVGILLANIIVLYNFFNDPPIWIYITSVAITSALLYPIIFRFSRIIFLHAFGGVKFEGKKYASQKVN